MKPTELWRTFLKEAGLPETTPCLECFHFDLTEKTANALLELVLQGVKKATSSSLPSFETPNGHVPQVGDYSIITDWVGDARCVIQTTAVHILPFRDMTFDLCRLEGEDDSLDHWRTSHINFFRAEGAELGYDFSEDMPVVFETFQVVYRA